MKLPRPRGPISTDLFAALRHGRGPGTPAVAGLADRVSARQAESACQAESARLSQEDARVDEDVQIALFACYGLHYDGFEDVETGWEWDTGQLAVRAALEVSFEQSLLAATGPVPAGLTPAGLASFLLEVASPVHGSALGQYVHRQANLEQFRELVIHRSIYNLREGDQHTWAIPRVTGRAKSALIEIQADEYGGGSPGRMHAELFAYTMEELGLDPTYGAYVEQIPGVSIAVLNLMSFFGLHRCWRGGLLGNLAVTEIGSSIANRRYSQALDRLGASGRARWFYDEHIEADAVHEQLAAHDMCAAFALGNPHELERVVLGALATLDLRRLFGATVTSAWNQGGTSLRVPDPA